MVAQRRYSVTGQTPPDDAEAMKARSPKLQALDTSVPRTSCGLCDGGAETSKLGTSSEASGPEQRRGRKMVAQAGTIVRTSSKRSATQLPSPNSPSHTLPPKIARYRLGPNDDVDMDMDTDTGSDVTDSTPEYSPSLSLSCLPDATHLELLQLCAVEGADDECMEDFALSPSHSRNHSLDRIQLDEKHEFQADWAAYQKLVDAHVPLTFLTLPPEIRHQIYRHCEKLVIDKPLVYCISTFDGEMQHALASVSRLVRSEALAIFYSYNLWLIKVEFRMMYEAFQDWIIRLGDGAGYLRLVSFAVRGALFKPKKTHAQSSVVQGHVVQLGNGLVGPSTRTELYCPPDGDASFKIDLSEKFVGGRVQIARNDGTQQAGEEARVYLSKMVEGLWEKRRTGTLNGQDWISMVDSFITFIGGW
ncbi:hypothetical protein EJ02DRAFT_355005 [Clathrospora elynae]|uniref:F-box domain-containing protein n=1 Tax=Clathrospora elynae TaxID=706981 RepID=A0A6A5SDW7_9PLEO|nr:hypothetical protein EJ02DRAFT_355005 [Clathrospora elynae]